jgi:hypothetical protein
MITDTFDRADGAPGANWTAFRTNNFAIASNLAAPGANNASRGGIYTGATWNADQASSAVIANAIDGDSYLSLIVRGSGAEGSRTAYYFSFNSTTWYITKTRAGSSTDVATATRTQAVGARLSVSAETSGANVIIRIWSGDPYTGTQIASWTDTGVTQGAVIASGSPGIEFYTTTTAIRANDWNGHGEVSGAAQALAGGAAGSGTAAGAATVTKPLAGGATGSGTAAGAAAVGKPLAGGATAASSAAGAATIGKPIAGSAQGAGAAAGELAAQHQLTVTLYQRPTPGAPAELLANATGLWWVWWSSLAAFLAGNAATAAGTGATTDANGVFLVQVNAAVTPGAEQGFGVIGNMDATADLLERAYVGTFDVL